MPRAGKRIHIASTSKHKIREISEMLSPLGFIVSGLQLFPDYAAPPETGKTFLENARIKALALRNFLLSQDTNNERQSAILADDSGLSCDDLKGAPGVHSARYAGENASDADNNRKLVGRLKLLSSPHLTARYVCALVFIDKTGKEFDVTQMCEGKIIFEPRGQNGFGYDPHFFIPELGKTMAQLPPEAKNAISHRGKALRELMKRLQNCFMSP